MRIAILGTRGVPANYGGFETFAEHLSTRLVARGHDVTVYCRAHYVSPRQIEFQGVRLKVLPTIRHKYLDTVIHTFLSALHAAPRRYDAALICNAANAPFATILRALGTPVALNVDGLEHKRKKWNWIGRKYYLMAERLATILPTETVTDAKVIQDYYLARHRAQSTMIAYGAEIERRIDPSVRRWRVEPLPVQDRRDTQRCRRRSLSPARSGRDSVPEYPFQAGPLSFGRSASAPAPVFAQRVAEGTRMSAHRVRPSRSEKAARV